MVKGFRGWQDNMAILNEFFEWNPAELAKAMTDAGRHIVITTAKDDTTNPPCMQEWWHEQLQNQRWSVMILFGLSSSRRNSSRFSVLFVREVGPAVRKRFP